MNEPFPPSASRRGVHPPAALRADRGAPTPDQAGASVVKGEGNAFGIYVHWPFCAAKCPYCDFNSHVRQEFDERSWARAIARELAFVAGMQGAERPAVQTIFFGGGTPSLASGAAIGEIIDTIAQLWQIAEAPEITLESNPASVEAGRFRDYRAAGVNRLSLGIQALNDADLKFLGRLHDVAEARKAIAIACNTFERVSLDFIYARPHQTLASWQSELREALAFGTEHLSLYQLTIEPATPFATLARAGTLNVPDEELAAALFETTQDLTQAAGLPAYEISNHARPGAECCHNLIYWRYGDYAGVGPGAHGRLTLDGRRVGTICEKLPERWRENVRRCGSGMTDRAEIALPDAAREHVMMSLRLSEGIDLAGHRARWNVDLDPLRYGPLVEAGLLACANDRLWATPRGWLVLDRIVAELAA